MVAWSGLTQSEAILTALPWTQKLSHKENVAEVAQGVKQFLSEKTARINVAQGSINKKSRKIFSLKLV